jgi:hypothetical protein
MTSCVHTHTLILTFCKYRVKVANRSQGHHRGGRYTFPDTGQNELIGSMGATASDTLPGRWLCFWPGGDQEEVLGDSGDKRDSGF